ncbi:MAG: oligosaccharide repeat unit polymerase [Candidatus Marinimicrobia bacterium]|nr:oligosaccharide repeat unit polymerase [Candidatus Neomarinimicrobiota bacterium]
MGIWAAVFGLNSLNLYPFEKIGFEALSILIGGILSVIIGYAIMSFALQGNGKDQLRDLSHFKAYFYGDSLRIVTIISMIIFLLGGLGSLLVISDLVGGVQMYILNPLIVRGTVVAIQMNQVEGVPLLYKLSGFFISIGLLSNMFGGALAAKGGKHKFIAYLPILVSLVVSLVFMRRYSFITGLILWVLANIFVSIVLDDKKMMKLRRKIVRIVVVLFLIVFVFNYVVVHARSFNRDDIDEYFYESLYSYFVGNMSSFEVWLSDPNDPIVHTYGQTTFRDFYKWAARLGLWADKDVRTIHQDFTRIGHKRYINTYTFVKAMYEDFNITGVLLLSLIWGAGAKWLMYRYLTKPTYITLFSAIIISFSLFMSFFSFYFRNMIVIVFWLIVLNVIQVVIRKNYYNRLIS